MCNPVRHTYERHYMTLFSQDLFRQFAIGFAIGGVVVTLTNPTLFTALGTLVI